VAGLAEHSESCDEVAPHRWLAARRGVADNLVWIEVIAPEEVEHELARACEAAVLDAIAARAEAAAIDTAASGLYALLSRARIDEPVGGVLVDKKRVFLAVAGERAEQAELDTKDRQGVLAWLKKRDAARVGLARLGGSSTELHQALTQGGVTVEPVRDAGLMKQAKKRGGAIKRAAAQVVAERLRDTIEGYAGLEPDELGLGEYLDRVDAGRLHAALADVRDVVAWERKHGKSARTAGVGVSLNPMVKSLADVRPGMEMTGVVANLTHFGAFVELGLAHQGLVHVSQLADKFVEHPSEVVQVGERVRVRVLEIDAKRQRISLTMRSGERKGCQQKRDARKESLAALDALFKK
jgi:transcriptional accessory protein Tex/SPT6